MQAFMKKIVVNKKQDLVKVIVESEDMNRVITISLYVEEEQFKC